MSGCGGSNEPARWEHSAGTLKLFPDAKTDFWQRTHYGIQADNGHFLFAEQEGDFVIRTHVSYTPLHRYDQAGLMIYRDAENWVKTSVECEDEGPFRLGVVVTRGGYSDWSTQDYASRRYQSGWPFDGKRRASRSATGMRSSPVGHRSALPIWQAEAAVRPLRVQPHGRGLFRAVRRPGSWHW